MFRKENNNNNSSILEYQKMNKLKIWSINIRNFQSSINSLQDILGEVNDIDILCIQETRLIDKVQFNEIFNEWILFTYEYNSKYGGTTILIKKNKKIKRISILNKNEIIKVYNKYKNRYNEKDKKYNIKESIFERFSLCKVYTNNNKYIIISLYQYTNEKHRKQLTKLYQVISSIIQSHYGQYKIIIASDLNTYLNPELDQSINSLIPHRFSRFLKSFMNENVFIKDSYRLIHPNKKQFTFREKTRIDTFLCCDHCKVLECMINKTINLNTDHDIIELNIDDHNLISYQQLNKKYKNQFGNNHIDEYKYNLNQMKLPYINKIKPFNNIDIYKYKEIISNKFKNIIESNNNINEISINDMIEILYKTISKSSNISLKKEQNQSIKHKSNIELQNILKKKEYTYRKINYMKEKRLKLVKRKNKCQTSYQSRISLCNSIIKLSGLIEKELKLYNNIDYNHIIAKNIYRDPNSIYEIISNDKTSINQNNQSFDKVVEKDENHNLRHLNLLFF